MWEKLWYNPENPKRTEEIKTQEKYAKKWNKENPWKVYRFDLDHLPKYKENERPKLAKFKEWTEREYLKYIIDFFHNYPLESGQKVESMKLLIKNNSIPKTKKFKKIIIDAINWKLWYTKNQIANISILWQNLFTEEDPWIFLDLETKQAIDDEIKNIETLKKLNYLD